MITTLPCEEDEFGTVKAELSGGSGEWCEGGATLPCGCGMGSNWLEYKSTVSMIHSLLHTGRGNLKIGMTFHLWHFGGKPV